MNENYNPDSLHKFLRSRRSVRHFTSEPVPEEMVQRILETAIAAPSAHNLQPWRFVVISSLSTKTRLAEAITEKFRQDMMADMIPETDIQKLVAKTIRRTSETPVIIVLCQDRTIVKPQPDAIRRQVEDLMSLQSVALAGLQILLAATIEGLGSNWICWPLFAQDETRAALGLPSTWDPQGMIFLGFSAESPVMPARIPLQEVIRYL